jgi:hypothetical protein
MVLFYTNKLKNGSNSELNGLEQLSRDSISGIKIRIFAQISTKNNGIGVDNSLISMHRHLT